MEGRSTDQKSGGFLLFSPLFRSPLICLFWGGINIVTRPLLISTHSFSETTYWIEIPFEPNASLGLQRNSGGKLRMPPTVLISYFLEMALQELDSQVGIEFLRSTVSQYRRMKDRRKYKCDSFRSMRNLHRYIERNFSLVWNISKNFCCFNFTYK